MRARVLGGLVGLILVGDARAAAPQPTQVLHEFTGYTSATGPTAPLIVASDVNLYGTTQQTGDAHRGTIFRMTPSGALTTLHTFIGGDDGAEPVAALLQAADGYFYGTTSRGGALDAGTVFRLAPGGQLNVLHTFAGSPDGAHPSAALIEAADGSFYGTTSEGGATGNGTVFRMTADGTVTVVHGFAGSPSDGAEPLTITQAADGTFYGVTRLGGTGNCDGPYRPSACAWGTIFSLTADGVTTILHSFVGSPTGDGSHPTSIILGRDGNFYGTTQYGGRNSSNDICPYCGSGTIFRMTPGGAVSTVHAFNTLDGANPIGGLLEAQDGRFYGTTFYGGGPPDYAGVVFQVTSSGLLTVLHKFDFATGGVSEAGLVQVRDGTMYGTTVAGGLNFGVAFRLDASGTYSVVHMFQGSVEGAQPVGPLVQASDGNLYGATSRGGVYNHGTIYRMTPAGVTTVAYTFAGGVDGGYPTGGLVQGRDGNLYGTTYRNGAYDAGTIFRLTLAGQLTTLHWFRGTDDGKFPSAGLVQARDDNFYGTTSRGGAFNQGTLFRMTPDGEVTVMHHFVAGSDGAYPTTALFQARDDNLYGTTSTWGGGGGTVYRLTSYGDYAVVHQFGFSNDGVVPNASLVQGRDNNLYGATACGTQRGGALFRLTSSGATVTLGFNNGYCSDYVPPTPNALVAAFDGTVYWATGNSVLALSPAGAWRFVDSLCCDDLALMQAADGLLYGTTAFGGARSAGTVFRLGAQPRLVVGHARSVLGDFNGDGKMDLVWREQLPGGDLAMWLMDGAQTKQAPVINVGLPMDRVLAGVGDLDGDGKADLIWQKEGFVEAWLMNGLTVRQAATIAPAVPLAWQIVGVADLNGDHKADLIWRHTQTGAVAVWLMDGVTVKEAPVVAPGVPLAWEIAGVGDLDGDGKADLVWRHTQTGDVAVWLMDGVSVKQAPVISPGVPLTWQIADVGDLDGDGKADLVWRHRQTGDVAVWLMDGLIATHTPVIATAVPLAWEIAGVGDLDADGKADLIWRQTETGDLAAWLMSGASVKQSEVVAPHVPLTWQID